MEINKNTGEQITLAQAQEMVNEFRKRYPDSKKGYFAGANHFNKILQQEDLKADNKYNIDYNKIFRNMKDKTSGFSPFDANLPDKNSYLYRGGVVYANNGAFIPKGTDTVPAMLTPGEFVVNRGATQRNLPLLQSLNNGGKVAYLANGTPGSTELMNNLKYLTEILKFGADTLSRTFQQAVEKLNRNIQSAPVTSTVSTNGVSNNRNPAATIDALGSRLDRFIEQLQASIPSVIKVEGQHQVNVVVNGASILQSLLGGPIGDIVQKAIDSAFDAKSRENEGN
jgi:hypothetical protein